jgi:hypothetical protein
VYKKIIFIILCVIAFTEAILLLRKRPIFCRENADCSKSQKCQNYLCADVGCLGEGQRYPGAVSPEASDHMAKMCCPGFKWILGPNDYDLNCKRQLPAPGSPGAYCSKKCGNQVCDRLETRCNCPGDCN